MKVFRYLRKRLLARSSKKYILYAFGEIFLIVLGILIALQIGKWNDNKSRYKKETLYLNAIEEDLNSQIGELEILLKNELLQCKNIESIMNVYSLNQQSEYLDSIYPLINELTNRKTFKLMNTTFSELNSTGQLDLISNDSLRSNIIKYYQFSERIEKIVENNNSNIVDDLYNKNLLPITLYSLDMISENLLKAVGIEDIPKYFLPSDKIRKTSDKIIAREENELLLFNPITRRYLVAKVQVLFYSDLKDRTTKLLDDINKI